MKKVLSFVLVGIFVVTCIYLTSQKTASIPLCVVIKHSYFTNDPREYEDNVPIGYEYYGTIHRLEKENQDIDLSTNTQIYMNREVYVNPLDDRFVYIHYNEYHENKYTRLYYETSFKD